VIFYTFESAEQLQALKS